MPRATASTDTTKVDLKSIDGAWVELRKMNYGEMLKRRDMVQTVRGGKGDNASMAFHFEEVQYFEFSRCVIDHNLEDEKGDKLNFTNKAHVLSLDSVVAGEIEELISTMNAPPGDEESKSVQSGS